MDKKKGRSNPGIDDLIESSENINLEKETPFLNAIFLGLGGNYFDKKLAVNICEDLKKIADPQYVSLIGWRDSLVTFVKTHSKSTISMLSCVGSYPTYKQIKLLLNKLKPSFKDIPDKDLITAFDNEQKLKKSYRLGGEEGSNKMTTSLCTMVLHLYPQNKSYLQFQPSLSPANWLWNKLPCISEYSKTFSQTLQSHKERWWNNLINDVFEVVDEPSMKKLKGDYEVSRVENRRSLYEFAVAKHTDNPAKIEVGRPHDLNPASYEDTKKILREESVKAGISKYGAGKRSWFAFVCDGSPYKNFLSLFTVLFFCTSCKKPCGEMKKHVNDKHGGKTDHIQMEFDHVLPLCGPGHVEKNILGAAITVLWDLIGLEKIAAVCNFKSKAQQELLKKVKDHHIAADFLIITLQTLAREILFEFGKEWKKSNTTKPTFSDLQKYFTPGSK